MPCKALMTAVEAFLIELENLVSTIDPPQEEESEKDS